MINKLKTKYNRLSCWKATFTFSGGNYFHLLVAILAAMTIKNLPQYIDIWLLLFIYRQSPTQKFHYCSKFSFICSPAFVVGILGYTPMLHCFGIELSSHNTCYKEMQLHPWPGASESSVPSLSVSVCSLCVSALSEAPSSSSLNRFTPWAVKQNHTKI
jgi:hypothetical protein